MRDRIRNGALAAVMVLLANGARERATAGAIDSVGLTTASGGVPYLCCVDLTAFNRHDSSVAISELRLTILSGHGAFQSGTSNSPSNWTIFQTPTTATWTSSAATADIQSGRSLAGFHICVRDTGIVRVLWETRNIDGTLSSDTLLIACRGIDCDQPFFHVQPSGLANIVDFDLIAGNNSNRVVDDFHLHLLTSGATFITSGGAVPAGWISTRARPDSLSYIAQNGGLARDRFVEGFRVELSAPRDAAIRVEWWSTSGGDVLCRDTVTLRFPALTRGDSVKLTRDAAGDCCFDLSYRNTHAAASVIDLFSFRILTPGATFADNPPAPDGWKSHALAAGRDSVFFTPDAGLASGDSALFESLCLDNAFAADDTIRYRWESFSRGVPVDAGTGRVVCLRPLVACDSVTAAADTIIAGGGRCISLRVLNRNSRGTAITGFVAHISNPGTARTILSATAPAGWQVDRFGGDSVLYHGAPITGSLSPFAFCVSAGDATTRDPLRIAWTTSGAQGTLCSDTVDLNLIIADGCDTARIANVPSGDSSSACFSISLANPLSSGRVLDSVRLSIGGGLSFSSASGPAPWRSSSAFPAREISFAGGNTRGGESTPAFSFCIDARSLAAPMHVPLVWTTFGGGNRICIDEDDLVVAPPATQACDSVRVIPAAGSSSGICIYDFSVRNLHLPPGTIDGVELQFSGGSGVFRNATVPATSGWFLSSLTRGRAMFRGTGVASGDSIPMFRITIDSAGSVPLTISICTYGGNLPLCCTERKLICGAASADESFIPGALTFLENIPNPTTGRTTVRYALSRPGEVQLLLHDASGREVRRITRPRQDAGAHAIDLDLSDLPSGIYFSTLSMSGEEVSFRLVIAK